MTSPAKRPASADPRTLVLAPNVRKTLVEGEEQEAFESSIALHGVQSPLSVRWADDGSGRIEVIAGQRRLLAALKAGLTDVPIHFGTISEEYRTAFQLVENIHRSDMSPLDVAHGVWELYTGPANGSQTLCAEMLGKPKSWVSKMLRIGADTGDSLTNTVAQSLLVGLLIDDVEMAYILCQIEALSLPEAQRLGKEIKAGEPHTRQTLRQALQQLQVAADDKPAGDESGDEGNGDEGGDGAASGEPAAGGVRSTHDQIAGLLTASELGALSLIESILKDATVPAGQVDRLQHARALITSIMAGAKAGA